MYLRLQGIYTSYRNVTIILFINLSVLIQSFLRQHHPLKNNKAVKNNEICTLCTLLQNCLPLAVLTHSCLFSNM